MTIIIFSSHMNQFERTKCNRKKKDISTCTLSSYSTQQLYYDIHAQNYAMYLIKCLEALINVEQTVLIAGDLNLPNVDWESFSAPHDKIQHPIPNFMQAEGFIQYVNQPTRDDKILDVLLCNDSLMISDCSVGPPVDRSDHNTVCFDMLLPMCDPNNNNVSRRFNFKRADYINLNNYLLGVEIVSCRSSVSGNFIFRVSVDRCCILFSFLLFVFQVIVFKSCIQIQFEF